MVQSFISNVDFFEGMDPFALVEEYGAPLYMYNERILRENCRKMKSLVKYPSFRVNYSVKANANLALLKIIKEEGLDVDAMSPGEIFLELEAGFTPDQIFYICNNVSADEMRFAIERGVLTSVDSLSQLELFGSLNPGGEVALRINPGIGVGHHAKVRTGGTDTKFGIDNSEDKLTEARRIARKHNLRIVGLNQHIGSLFMDSESYVQGAHNLAAIAGQFDDLRFVDLGGGFGVPYRKLSGETALNLHDLGRRLDDYMDALSEQYGSTLELKIEPGRFIPCESGVILSPVNSIKDCYGTKYVGTDIGFNVLARPMAYDAHHDIEVFSKEPLGGTEVVTVVGNICETGDVLARARELPRVSVGDMLCVLDAGAYGMSMASNYNMRLRPAEVLIKDGKASLIRKRDTLEGLLSPFL